MEKPSYEVEQMARETPDLLDGMQRGFTLMQYSLADNHTAEGRRIVALAAKAQRQAESIAMTME